MRRAMIGLGLALAAAFCGGGTARADATDLPPEIQAKIREMGPVLDRTLIDTTFRLLRPLVKAAPMTGIRIERDIADGPDARNKLDLYVAEKHGAGMPIVIFIHGGGFVSGAKNEDGIYGNVAAFFAKNGMVGITADYRLAPKDPWPAGAQDVGKAVAWAKAHAAELGGDPQKIYLMGHSAGATHVASYVLDPLLAPSDGPGVAGAILVSGFYRVARAELQPNIEAYFGRDEQTFDRRSPLTHVYQSKLPLMVVLAEYDPPFLATPSLALEAEACNRDKKCPTLLYLKGHNHISEIAAMDTVDRQLGLAIIDFIHHAP